jgi:hypothetical protein
VIKFVLPNLFSKIVFLKDFFGIVGNLFLNLQYEAIIRKRKSRKKKERGV